jgi:RND family efflux transporter MFP subunit
MVRKRHLLLSCLLIIAACGPRNEPASGPAAVPVRTAMPAPFAAAGPVRAIGRIEAAEETTLSFASGGVVARLTADIGEPFARGRLLAELDATALDAALTQAQRAEDQSRRDLARVESLVARQLVARQQLDDARTVLDQREAESRRAGNARRYGTISAPQDGFVLQRLVEPGEVVAAGQPVLRIASRRSGFSLKAEVADREAAGIRTGDRATVTVDALPDLLIPARVTRVGGQAGEQSGSVTVELQLQANVAGLRSGLIAKLRLTQSGDAAATGLGIPTAALLEVEEDRAQVYVAKGGLAEQRSIRIGRLGADQVQVLEGLAADEPVITAGQFRLRDGVAIAIADAGEAR